MNKESDTKHLSKHTAPSSEPTKVVVPDLPAHDVPAHDVPAHGVPVTSEKENALPAFPIVGIGASAGGLEALELFLSHVPANCGMAFVIVQHLDPTRKGMLVEILQRSTPMPVVQVKDRTSVKPGCVYVIPPNKDMSIQRGVLHLLVPVTPRGLRLPINFFFRSMAEDLKERSIGVILSGMGSDGSLGLQAIKEQAGTVFVQAPGSAKFDGMPRSAIESGLADVVAPAEALPDRIMSALQHPYSIQQSRQIIEDEGHTGLEKVLILLRSQTGHDFSAYKRTTVYRRIERRMSIHQIDKIGAYVRYLQENSKEVDLLFQGLLIGVTHFFRDPPTWDKLKSEVLPALLADRAPGHLFRAWVAGCATGEEAYSLAIAFKDAVEQMTPAPNISLQIFATDLDQNAIVKAREGIFPASIAADVTPAHLNRYFIPVERGYQVSKSIRDMVIFVQHNLIMDPPFTKLDILSCRNLLIYLTAEIQTKLLPLFHYSLNPGGFLFLGSTETIGGFTDLFRPLDDQVRLYRHLDADRQKVLVEFPTRFLSTRRTIPVTMLTQSPTNLQALADQLLLQQYSPAAVLTDNKGDIIYISGRTGKYLEPAAGKANWNVFAMVREGLRHELAGAFQKVLAEKIVLELKDLTVGTNGGTQRVEMTLQLINEPVALRKLVMIVFKDVATPPRVDATDKRRRTSGDARRVAELEQQIVQFRWEMQSMRNEVQASEEELKSTNEEFQSTNEELQSTNEELTTSKEEMQSLNEELQTINQELQIKVDELSHTNNDLKNLYDSTDLAILFLDGNLNVRRFTHQATRITKLIASDVGRPITDIASSLLYPELTGDVEQVLRTLTAIKKQTATKEGRWYETRILPYRTLENKIDGVVITFTDITISKTLEAELRAKEADLQRLLDGRP